MKKFQFLALMGAAALTGATLFSCSNDELAEVNPNYNPETGEVTTSVVFNIPASAGQQTRMSADNTQATFDAAFRGIDNAHLLSFKLPTDGKYVETAQTADKIYNLDVIMTEGAISGKTPTSHRILELALPTSTNTLMTWGKAIKTGTDNSAHNQYGYIDYHVEKNIANTYFELQKRIADTDRTKYEHYADVIARVLTKIVQAKETYADIQFGSSGASLAGTLSWKEFTYVDVNGKLRTRSNSPVDSIERAAKGEDVPGDPKYRDIEPMTPLGEILGNAFVSLNTIYPNEVRAGSGPAVLKIIKDLDDMLKPVANATATSVTEMVVIEVAKEIRAEILKYVNVETSAWQAINNIKTSLGVSYDDVIGSLADFPKVLFNVPLGAASVSYSISENKYSPRTNLPTYSMSGTADGTFDIFNYRYPAELCYFGNSPIRVTDQTVSTSEYPQGVTAWDTDASWTSKEWSTTPAHVLSTTRSVAMKYNINYGTALLKTTVRYGAAVLEDNNAQIQHNRKGSTEDPITIATVGATPFSLTGILVGGVNPKVGWNYLPIDPTAFTSFVYDNALGASSSSIPSYDGTKEAAQLQTAPNYTLLWDNWNQNDAGLKQNVVYIALEFVNNSGKDFWGMNNLIRQGNTFYITGKLDPDVASQTKLDALGKTAAEYAADKSLGVDWPTAAAPYALPPYDGSGNTIKQRRVFIQDHVTEANFVINANSLKYALISVPDLRSAQISLGLSVDLEWKKGLNFEDIILGN